jgi:hypothetical protein
MDDYLISVYLYTSDFCVLHLPIVGLILHKPTYEFAIV